MHYVLDYSFPTLGFIFRHVVVYIITSECNESDASIKKAKTKAEIDATKAADERRKEGRKLKLKLMLKLKRLQGFCPKGEYRY